MTTLLSVSSPNNSTIVLHFDRDITAGGGSIVVSDGYGQTYLTETGLSTRIVNASDQRVLAATDSSLSYSGQDVTIHLSTPLKNGLNYSITMSSFAVMDDGDDGNARISSPNLFKFTATGSAATIATPSAVVASTIHFTDTGTSSSDYITASAEQVMTGSYTGTLGASDFVQVSLDNGASWHKATVNTSAKTWSYTGEIDLDNLTDGAGDALNGTLLARISNTSGGNSGTASHSYVYNSHAVEIDVSSSFSFSADTGTSSTDLITKTASQTISGSYSGALLAGYVLQVSVDGGDTWVNATASAGSWHTTSAVTLKSGANAVQARVTDAAGNTSGVASADYKLLTSTVSLSGHALTLPGSTDSGVSASDGITTSASKVTLNVAGLHGFHAGDTIQIVDTSHSSAVVGSYVILDSDLYYGDDYFTISKFSDTARSTVDINLDTLADGAHTLAARIVDVAGNIATASGTTTVTIDGKIPLMSTSAPLEDATGVSTGLTKLTFTFNENIAIADGTVVTITDDNNSNNYQEITLSSSAASGNKLTINLSSALTSGTSYTVIGAIVTDLAGNVGTTGDTPLLHFTTAGTYSGGSVPTAPSIYFLDTAPEASTDSSLLHDGITNDNLIRVEGLDSSGTWYYRTSTTGSWIAGTGFGFTLADGTYAMDTIQVKQTVDGVDSAIATIHETVVVDTDASAAGVVGSAFSSGANSLSGFVSGSTDFSGEYVELTFDHGNSWVQAPTTYLGSGTSSWTLTGISGDVGIEYGVRLADKAGNLSGLPGATAYSTVYYMADGGVTYNHPDDNYSSVFGGSGADTITVGNHVFVFGGDNDTVSTGDDTIVTVGSNATVTTTNGTNVVVADDHANISTGSGMDYIALSSLTGAVVHAGAGVDTLEISSDTVFSLSSLSSSSGIDVIDFTEDGVNGVTILSATTVQNLTDSNKLTIDNSGGGTTTVTMDSLVWHADGTSGSYHVYHNATNTIAVLVGAGITVDLEAFSA